MEIIVRDLQKYKYFYEGKIRLSEDKEKIMKEKYEFNLTEIISQT